MSERKQPYDRHTDGPLYLQPQKRNRRTVTMPDRVGPHVKLVFAEMARQRRHYDAVAEASGVRRASLKAWRRKNRPGLESLEAVLNALGWRLIPTPGIEVMPPQFGAEIARLAAAAQVTIPDVWAAMTLLAAGQLAASENGHWWSGHRDLPRFG